MQPHIDTLPIDINALIVFECGASVLSLLQLRELDCGFYFRTLVRDARKTYATEDAVVYDSSVEVRPRNLLAAELRSSTAVVLAHAQKYFTTSCYIY